MSNHVPVSAVGRRSHGQMIATAAESRAGGRLSSRRVPAAVGIAAFAVSLATPMGYDEAFWVGIARMVETGRTLYEGALDNKTPAVYALAWLLDKLPGPFVLWRALAVGAAVSVLTVGFRRLVGRSGAGTTWPVVLLVGLVVLLAEGQLTTEFVAVTLLALALARDQGRNLLSPALLALGAVAFDPRAIVLLPGVLLLLDVERRRAVAAVVSIGVATAIGLTLLVPDLRYGLVEMNLTSRSNLGEIISRLPRQWMWVLAGFLPLALVFSPDRRRRGRAVLLIGAIAIPLLSVQLNPHYAIYLPLALTLFIDPLRREVSKPIAGALVIAALAPAAIGLVQSARAHRELAQTSERVATVLRDRLEPGQTYVMFGALTPLVAEFPEANALRSATSLYLGLSTSRSDAHRAELPDMLEDAAAVVDGGGLAVPRRLVLPDQRPIYDVFQTHLDGFPCRVEIDERATVWLRENACRAR